MLKIPNLSMSMQHTPFDWGYRIEMSNKSCRSNHLAIKDGGCYWPRGKMLGGSDSMSNMLYLRGNKMDFNEWEQIVKSSEWGWENVLKYYKKSENNEHIELLNIDRINSEQYHSKNGLLKVNSFTRNVYDLQIYKYMIIEAAQELNYEYVKDFNSGKYLGFSQVQGTISDGVRDTTMKSFLNSALIKNRSNLHVIKNALVTKINIDEIRSSINGIEYQLNGTTYQANSRKEIILSAGVIGTPQILMLSGIGPKQDLEKLNIKIQQNLPVGQNLQDHISISLYFQFNSTKTAPIGKEELLDHLYYFVMQRAGPFATIGISDLVGFINTNNDSKNTTIKNSAYPNIQLNFQYFVREALDLQFYLTISDFQEMIGRRILDANQYYDIVIVNIQLLKPKSIGKIMLRSVNPIDPPLIQANYLNDNNDIDTILNGIKFVQQFSNSKSFETADGKLMRLPLIDCKTLEYESDSYWKCYIKYMSRSSYNPVGTAKMASSIDDDGKKTAVVDYRLRVLGIKGLRVIDASIMPTIVSASVNPTTIMIAEKGSDMIKDDWQDSVKTKLPTQEL